MELFDTVGPFGNGCNIDGMGLRNFWWAIGDTCWNGEFVGMELRKRGNTKLRI